ncbi:MAG TPA: acetate--CoA ligase family protein, partial [bacterium]|nr:acetate--CoA ligase family protein [bacterium]
MKIDAILDEAAAEGRRTLLEYEAEKIFSEAGIPVAPGRLAVSAEDAAAAAAEIGYPVVMKIMSAQIVHKSDAGGVKVGLKTGKEVEAAWKEIVANAAAYDPEASIRGVLVQKMISVPDGREVIVGASTDPQFG